MNRIVYSKYSNERSRKFQIRTDIIEDENKRRQVCKSACTKEAQDHIDQIDVWRQKLNQAYASTMLEANKCTKKDGKLYFEFMEGQTFEERLDNLLKQEDYAALIDEIKNFFETVKKTLSLKLFQPTPQFRSVFGDIEFPESLQAGDLNNIDYIFGNVFLQENKWTIIDYEWTFDFPIPFLYIVYRAVHYYTYDDARKKLKDIGMLRIMGIDEKLEQCFQLMENHFQLYILGEVTAVVNMYQDIAGKAYPFAETLAAEKKLSEQYSFRVYYNNGDGFREDNAVTIAPTVDERGVFHCSFPVREAKSLRIDPGEASCLLSDIAFFCNGDAYDAPSFQTNGALVSEGCYAFATPDPMLLIPAVAPGAKEIEFSCRFAAIDKNMAVVLPQYFQKYEQIKTKFGDYQDILKLQEAHSQLEKDLNEYKKQYSAIIAQRDALLPQIADKDRQIAQLNAQYLDILNSTSVKITKPLRFFTRAVKKLLKSNKVTYKCARGLKCLKENGVRYTYRRAKEKVHKKMEPKTGYWRISSEELQRQRQTVFARPVLFSVIVPLYNTPEKFLCEMIESVQGQTYGNWELCMADGSDDAHGYVEKICKKYAKNDKRILYRKLESNQGISENTNRCLEMAHGQYIALFDHDDLLHPSALFENMRVIDAQNADFIYSDEDTFSATPLEAYCPHFKPDFSPDTLRSYNYICHLTVFRRSLLDEVGLFRKEFDGSQDYDMILRLTEKAKVIVHIPKIIYYWRAHAASVASDISAKTYCMDAAKKALNQHLLRVGLKGEAIDSQIPSVYKIQYQLVEQPLISILIPNKDYREDLAKCIDSIFAKSTYRNFEIIVIENNSELPETFAFYEELEKNEQIRVVRWEREFNYSAINNFGFSFAKGQYILLLNNDLEVISPDWLQEMLMFAQRKDVGAVGAKLYYPDDTIQHAGVIFGLGGVAGHSHKYFPRDHVGYSYRLMLAQNLSCVTAACLMLHRDVFSELNGLDEGFQVAFNDVDFCMRIRKAGYLVVFTPFAELYHYESKSRGQEDTPEKIQRFQGEISRFKERWGKELEQGDPYYNVNLTLDREDFSVK